MDNQNLLDTVHQLAICVKELSEIISRHTSELRSIRSELGENIHNSPYDHHDIHTRLHLIEYALPSKKVYNEEYCSPVVDEEYSRPYLYSAYGGKPVLVLFYMDGCGPCKQIWDAWDTVRQRLNDEGQINTLEIESANTQEIRRNNIEGFPTIKMFPSGYPSNVCNSIEYMGNRSVESLLKFASRFIPSVEVCSKNESDTVTGCVTDTNTDAVQCNAKPINKAELLANIEKEEAVLRRMQELRLRKNNDGEEVDKELTEGIEKLSEHVKCGKLLSSFLM